MLIARLRAREFSRLDRTGHVYLDYTGSALYPASLVRRHARLMTDRVLGNPHSESGPSRASTAAIETARSADARTVRRGPCRLRRRVHRQRERRHPDARRSVSVRSRIAPGADGGQPQLGQRPSRGGPAAPGGRCLRSAGRGTAGGRSGILVAAPEGRLAVRVPGAVEFLRRQASAGLGRRCAAAGIPRPGRRSRVRRDEPAVAGRRAGGLRRRLVLQAVRLSDRRRRADRQARRARVSPARLFRRRHRAVRVSPEPPRGGAAGSGSVRGRHAEFSRHARRLRRLAVAAAPRTCGPWTVTCRG